MNDRDQGSGFRDQDLGNSRHLRIYESRMCRSCGEPSFDQSYCSICAEEIALLEELYGEQGSGVRDQGSDVTLPAPASEIDRIVDDEVDRLMDFAWAERLWNRFMLAFLICGALGLAGCIVKGLMWVYWHSGQ